MAKEINFFGDKKENLRQAKDTVKDVAYASIAVVGASIFLGVVGSIFDS
jgi:hypothetical protein